MNDTPFLEGRSTKLCELNGRLGEWGEAYEILSCLVHASGIRRKLANDTYVDMDDTEIERGMSKIKEFIPDFDFEEYKVLIRFLE